MIKIDARKIEGPWEDGYALDRHTVRSEYIGDNEFGHPQFNTTRSEVGELLFKLKYRSDYAVVDQLAEAAASFVVRGSQISTY